MDIKELLTTLQGGVTNLSPHAGAQVVSGFATQIESLNRPELEAVRRELFALQFLLEGRTPDGLNAVGIGQQLIAVGRTLKTIPLGDDAGMASTLGYMASALEQQGRTLVGDLEVARAPDARFANAEANVVAPADAPEVTPGNPYASLHGV